MCLVQLYMQSVVSIQGQSKFNWLFFVMSSHLITFCNFFFSMQKYHKFVYIISFEICLQIEFNRKYCFFHVFLMVHHICKTSPCLIMQ